MKKFMLLLALCFSVHAHAALSRVDSLDDLPFTIHGERMTAFESHSAAGDSRLITLEWRSNGRTRHARTASEVFDGLAGGRHLNVVLYFTEAYGQRWIVGWSEYVENRAGRRHMVTTVSTETVKHINRWWKRSAASRRSYIARLRAERAAERERDLAIQNLNSELDSAVRAYEETVADRPMGSYSFSTGGATYVRDMDEYERNVAHCAEQITRIEQELQELQ